MHWPPIVFFSFAETFCFFLEGICNYIFFIEKKRYIVLDCIGPYSSYFPPLCVPCANPVGEGAGYLNFMGNEFGHPEWVDFPRDENGWSHHLCRRRWDLADDESLRYKYFQNFDELMQALENRFKWLRSEHEFVTICNGMDKVLAFERGDLIFVVNLDPNRSFQGYQACLD